MHHPTRKILTSCPLQFTDLQEREFFLPEGGILILGKEDS